MSDKKLPPKDKLIEIIKQVVSSRFKVESQEELYRLVLKQLKKIDKNYIISPIRAKRIALLIPEIEVKAKTKRTVRLQKITKCPICDSAIEPLKVKNLLNKDIVIGYRCTRCAYESDLEAFMPMKYYFRWKSL
jgi:transposase-like protein